MTAPIIDPFFDAGSRTTSRPDQANIGQHSQPAYNDISREYLTNGQPVAHVLPTGPGGLRGVLLRPSTEGGVPAGYNPHQLTDMEMTVDPHISGQSRKVRLNALTKEAVQQASAAAQQNLAGSQVFDNLTDHIARRRFRASMAMHSIDQQGPVILDGDDRDMGKDLPVTPEKAAETNYQQPAQPQQPPQPQRPPQAAQQAPAQPTQPWQPPQRVASPLAAFNQPAGTPIPAQQPVMNVVDTSQPLRPQAQPPQKKVTFEFPEAGMLEAYYHDVIKSDATLVLVYDERHQGTRYMPPQASEQQIAVHPEGADVVYLVEATGIQYSHGTYTYCVLSIAQEAPYN